jgi:hypothetical protein
MAFPPIHAHLEPQNTTLNGSGTFANIMESCWIKMGPKSSEWCLYKKRTDTREGDVGVEGESGVMQL